MVHAALLLLMFEAVPTDLVFTISLKRSTQNLQLSTSWLADYPIYCYLPLYVFCGRHLLDAKLRRASLDAADGAVEAVARIVAQIRRRWPKVRILVRADSGFAREELMAWCEANGVHFLFGLAQNESKRSFRRTYAVERGDGMRCPP
jgi:Transposase DDE domain group 1